MKVYFKLSKDAQHYVVKNHASARNVSFSADAERQHRVRRSVNYGTKRAITSMLAAMKPTNESVSAGVKSSAKIAGVKRGRSDISSPVKMLEEEASPADFVKQAFEELTSDGEHIDFSVTFVEPTQSMIDAYKMETIQACRSQDLAKLRQLFERGEVLNCCNRFGESLIHMACRRGDLDTVKFLLLEADASLYIRDDYGRTPLHDACWTPSPKFDLIDFLIEQAPEFLNVKDVRGHTPLHYIRREHWAEWTKFLTDRKEKLRFKRRHTLNSYRRSDLPAHTHSLSHNTAT